MSTFLLFVIFLLLSYGASALFGLIGGGEISYAVGAVIGLAIIVLIAYSEIKSRLDTVISNQNEMKKSLEPKQDEKTDGADKTE